MNKKNRQEESIDEIDSQQNTQLFTQKLKREYQKGISQLEESKIFPADKAEEFGDIKISGHYESTSSCGGDWGYYSLIDNKVYIFIGDATGHGDEAALVTSVARSAISLIESVGGTAPEQIMEMFNVALFAASAEQMMMTLFMAMIDIETGLLYYVNAGHEPPLLLRKQQQKHQRQDIIPLVEGPVGRRLGEIRDVTYQSERVQLKRGDTILFYTDGITEMVNVDEEMFGERRLLKSYLAAYYAHDDVFKRMEYIKRDISNHRNNAPLKDDVTFLLCQYG